MASKPERRANRAKKKKRAQAKRKGEGRAPDSSFEMNLVETYDLYQRFVTSHASKEAATQAARAELRANAAKIATLSCGMDLLVAVPAVWMNMSMASAVTGVEPSAAALEYLTLILAHRDKTAGTGEIVSAPERFDQRALGDEAREGVALGGLLAYLDAVPLTPDSNLVFRTVQREILLRNPVYPDMLIETLRKLFDDPGVDADCRSAMGFTATEALEVMAAAREATIAELVRRNDAMHNAMVGLNPYLDETSPVFVEGTETPSEEAIAAGQALMAAVEDLTTNLADATAIDAAAITQIIGLGPDLVGSVLNAFTYAATSDLTETVDRFMEGDNPLRTAPVIADAGGRRMLVHDALALPAVREVIETRLKQAGLLNRYQRHRGIVVEDASMDLLTGVFPGASVHRGLKYFVPDPKATTPQTTPATFTGEGECDGLILIDDVALIIEVKAVGLTAASRRGVALRLKTQLQNILTKAADQAQRLRERIVTDGVIRPRDGGSWIDVSNIREVHTIAVGLEDLSGITTATAALVEAGILRDGEIPWTVSVHDLRIICELIDRPSDLLLYLRRRTHPTATRTYRAVDELDLFMYFLQEGLVVPPEAGALPGSTPAQTAAEQTQRSPGEKPIVIPGITGPIDDWFMTRGAGSPEVAPKPQLAVKPGLVHLLGQILGTAAPGALATATAILEATPSKQRQFARAAKQLVNKTRQSDIDRQFTASINETGGQTMIVVWQCQRPGQSRDEAVESLTAYLRTQQQLQRAHRAAGLLFDNTGTTLEKLVYLDKQQRPGPVLS